MAIAQKRNELPTQGLQPPTAVSLLSFSDAQIIDTANILGVSLGSSLTDRLVSAKMIKDNELMRTLTIIEKKDNVSNNVDSVSQCLVVSRASHLSEDLDDYESLGEEDVCDVPPVVVKERKTRKKKSYDRKNVRRSNRLRIKKSNS